MSEPLRCSTILSLRRLAQATPSKFIRALRRQCVQPAILSRAMWSNRSILCSMCHGWGNSMFYVPWMGWFMSAWNKVQFNFEHILELTFNNVFFCQLCHVQFNQHWPTIHEIMAQMETKCVVPSFSKHILGVCLDPALFYQSDSALYPWLVTLVTHDIIQNHVPFEIWPWVEWFPKHIRFTTPYVLVFLETPQFPARSVFTAWFAGIRFLSLGAAFVHRLAPSETNFSVRSWEPRRTKSTAEDRNVSHRWGSNVSIRIREMLRSNCFEIVSNLFWTICFTILVLVEPMMWLPSHIPCPILHSSRRVDP